MNALKLAAAVLISLILAGCASSKSGDVYSRDQARREMLVRTGVVESVREVTMEGTSSGAGTFAGAAVGGVAGSTVGGGRGQIVGAIIGALYLKRFVTNAQDWVHIDLFAWNPKDRPGRPVGAEAHAVRALYAMLAERYA